MKPRNFPGRKARRQARAALNRGVATDAQLVLLTRPKDITIRVGAARRGTGDVS